MAALGGRGAEDLENTTMATNILHFGSEADSGKEQGSIKLIDLQYSFVSVMATSFEGQMSCGNKSKVDKKSEKSEDGEKDVAKVMEGAKDKERKTEAETETDNGSDIKKDGQSDKKEEIEKVNVNKEEGSNKKVNKGEEEKEKDNKKDYVQTKTEEAKETGD